MISAGIDLGGSKIEAQLFDAEWQVVARQRLETPRTYDALVSAMANTVTWIETQAPGRPIGISAAGLINRTTGLALTANLPASGRPFPADLIAAAGRRVTFLNDCRALTLSEAVFGAAQGKSPALGLILGTGIGGGIAIDGALLESPAGLSGEFGHFALAAGPVLRHALPVVACGCGRVGCSETLISGPGLSRIVAARTGRTMQPAEIAAARKSDPVIAESWSAWLELVTELLMTLCLTLDPACIVLGGGLSRIDGLLEDLRPRLVRAQLAGFPVPELLIAEGGDASGARGAAWHAWQERQRHDV